MIIKSYLTIVVLMHRACLGAEWSLSLSFSPSLACSPFPPSLSLQAPPPARRVPPGPTPPRQVPTYPPAYSCAVTYSISTGSNTRRDRGHMTRMAGIMWQGKASHDENHSECWPSDSDRLGTRVRLTQAHARGREAAKTTPHSAVTLQSQIEVVKNGWVA
jgi:hypothetical protein